MNFNSAENRKLLGAHGLTPQQVYDEGAQLATSGGLRGEAAELFATTYVDQYGRSLVKERARIASILCSREADRRPILARKIAFETDTEAAAAIGILAAAEMPRSSTTGDAYPGFLRRSTGADAEGSGADAPRLDSAAYYAMWNKHKPKSEATPETPRSTSNEPEYGSSHYGLRDPLSVEQERAAAAKVKVHDPAYIASVYERWNKRAGSGE